MRNKRKISAEIAMSDKPKAGGYVTFQLLDAIRMTTSDIKRDIEATTRVSVDAAEFYRLLAKFSLQIQNVDQTVNELEEIFRR